MSTSKTGISWTDRTWNVCTGCTKVSAGCTHCYAERMANRLVNIEATRARYEGTVKDGRWTGRVNCIESALDEPLRWRKPARVFVNSMSDLFHEDVPDGFINCALHTIEHATQHTFMVLTKRPQRMAEHLHEYVTHPMWGSGEPLKNLWLGVSVENQQAADERIPWLLQTPAAVRFISAEPLIGPVNLSPWLDPMGQEECTNCGAIERRCLSADERDALLWTEHGDALCPECGHLRCATGYDDGLDWTICGGESGPNARPMHPDWARSLRDQCAEAGVPFHFKQWGEWLPAEMDAQPPFWNFQNGTTMDGHAFPDFNEKHRDWIDWLSADKMPVIFRRVGKARAGRLLDGVLHDAFPEAAR